MPSVLATHLSATHTFVKHPQASINLLKGLGVEGDAHAGKKTQHEYYIKVDSRKGELRDNNRQVHLVQSELFDEEGFCHEDGTSVLPGQMGENITTVGVDLLALSKGTKLRFVETTSDEIKVQDTAVTAERTLFPHLVHFFCFALLGVAATKADWLWCYTTIAASFGFLILRLAYQKMKTVKKSGPVVELTGRRKPCKKIDENVGKGLLAKVIVKDENGKTVGHKAGIMGIVEVGGLVKPGMKIVLEKPKLFEELPPI